MSDYSTYSDEQLVALLVNSNQAAFVHLLDRYQRKVYKQALYWLKDQQLAEETTQDIFLKIWLKRHLMTSVVNFDNYLFVLAKNTILNALENISRKVVNLRNVIDFPNTEIADNSHSADHAILFKDAEANASKIINFLPPIRRKVFIMNRFQYRTYDEIAEELDISRSGVRDHMVKALQFLRKTVSSKTICLILFFGAL